MSSRHNQHRIWLLIAVISYLGACVQAPSKAVQPNLETTIVPISPTYSGPIASQTVPASVEQETPTLEIAPIPVQATATPLPLGEAVQFRSPDNNWAVSIALVGGSIQVERTDGMVKWVVDDPKLIDPSWEFWIEKWSATEDYLYLGTSPVNGVYSDIERWYGFYPDYSLLRLDLGTGAVTTILEPVQDVQGYWQWGAFALSPDETQLIYARWGQSTVVIRDLLTQVERVVELNGEYPYVGNFVWSPNGEMAVFSIVASNPNITNSLVGYPARFALVRLDLGKLTTTELITGKEDQWFPVAVDWDETGQVAIFDSTQKAYWQLDPQTAHLQPMNTTAVPR